MAGAAVGGAFLAASIQVLFDKLAARGIGDFIWGRKHEEELLVNKLTATLFSVEAILHDAVKKRTANSAVSEWLNELEATVNEAQSLLDGIAVQNSKSRSGSRSTRTKTMREILSRLEHMSGQKDVLDLIELSYILPTTSIPAQDSNIVRRVPDKEGIVSILLSSHVVDQDPLRVIGIVGVPGIGKTALAQLVYNDHRMDEHFDLKVWVCLSSRPDTYTVTKTIFGAVTSATCDIDDLNLLQLKLGEQVIGKKLLLVLDDVWSIEDCTEWEVLTSPFRFCARGSGIVITTRNEVIAGIVQTLPVHHLSPLSDEECWSLFSKYAYGDGYSAADPGLEEIGRELVRKCRGLPMAAKTLGILVREKPEREEWDKILKDEIWDSASDTTDILSKLTKQMVKGRKQVRESRRERSADHNLTSAGDNSVPSNRNINSKQARLPVYCVIWLVVLGILSASVFEAGNTFRASKRKEALGSTCDIRAKMLRDQFMHHVHSSYSFVIYLTQVHRMNDVLDNDQCGAALFDYVSGAESMFPFLGTVTYELFVRGEYKPIMACHEYATDDRLAPLNTDKMDVMNAIAAGENVISSPFKHSHDQHLQFALIVPLYSGPRIYNSTKEQRIRAGVGYIGMIFKFDSLVEHVLEQLDGNQTIVVAVHDVTNSSELLLYGFEDRESDTSHVHKHKLDLGDPFRKYMITCRYRQKAPVSWIVITITGLTIAIGLLLGCMFLGAAIHSLRIQELEVRADAADAARSSHLSAASTEMRMPVNNILEALMPVLSTEPRSPQKDYVRVAQEGCKRLIVLIDEFADTKNPDLPFRRRYSQNQWAFEDRLSDILRNQRNFDSYRVSPLRHILVRNFPWLDCRFRTWPINHFQFQNPSCVFGADLLETNGANVNATYHGKHQNNHPKHQGR